MEPNDFMKQYGQGNGMWQPYGNNGKGLVYHGAGQDTSGIFGGKKLNFDNNSSPTIGANISGGAGDWGNANDGWMTKLGLGDKDGNFDMGSLLGTASQGMKLFGGLAEMGLFGGTPESRLQEKALNEQIAASKRGFNANATSYNHQVGRADGYNARHGVGPSEKIKKVL